MILRAITYSLYSRLEFADHNGIGIVAYGNQAIAGPLLLKSLQLLERAEPRRYERVKQHVRWVTSLPDAGGFGCASYNRYLRRCKIDLVGGEVKNVSDEYIPYLASVVVYVATHGRLCLMGTKYNAQNRMQIERICVAEQNRALRRIDLVRPGSFSKFHRQFDPANWPTTWNRSRFGTIRALASQQLSVLQGKR